MSLTLAPATPDDYEVFARLFPELAVPEQTPPYERFVTTIVPGAIVVRDEGGAVGYAWGRARGERFHVVHVIADPAHRRRGVGRALMAALAQRARHLGFTRWMLNVKPENVGARALYERSGMRVVAESVSMRVAWDNVARLAHVPASRLFEPRPADDARVEAALALPRGELASYRALERRLFVVEDAQGASGFAAFDASFPGAAPFKPRTPGHARALLEAMKPHASSAYLLVFVEADAPLEAALAAAGATPAMRVLRMEGDL
jgi:ribosomal-protein-alanine N-acetyltransferase